MHPHTPARDLGALGFVFRCRERKKHFLLSRLFHLQFFFHSVHVTVFQDWLLVCVRRGPGCSERSPSAGQIKGRRGRRRRKKKSGMHVLRDQGNERGECVRFSACRAGPLCLPLMCKACGQPANMAIMRQEPLARPHAAAIYFPRSFKCLWKCGSVAISWGNRAEEHSSESPGRGLKFFSVVSSNSICSFFVCNGTTAATPMPLMKLTAVITTAEQLLFSTSPLCIESLK